MTKVSRGLVLGLVAYLLCGLSAQAQQAGQQDQIPLLVTYGKHASIIEGDHDHRQVIRFSLPASTQGPVYVRVFDPDSAGSHDFLKRGLATTTRFSLHAGGPGKGLKRDAQGIWREDPEGRLLAQRQFGPDPASDNSWQVIAETEASQGALMNGRREFFLKVEGVTGNDGNAYSVAVSVSEVENLPPDGLRLYSFLPTVRVPDRVNLTELSFIVPQDAQSLTVYNFDAAYGAVAYSGEFRSVALKASGQKAWQATTFDVQEDERGRIGAITLFDGAERPNDITLAIEDDRGMPVALLLPPRLFAPDRRPLAEATATPLSCNAFEFDASGTRDPEGKPLTFVWRFHDGSSLVGAKVRKAYDRSGDFSVRLEAFDTSGQVGSGDKVEFTLPVKLKPKARASAPEKASQGAPVTLDGTASVTDPGYPDSAFIWSLPDGSTLSGAKPTHAFQQHGEKVIRLTVRDSGIAPCNEDSAETTLYVDALPRADAGANRGAVVGEVLRFDGGGSSDPDGRITSYAWAFGDGGSAARANPPHAFHEEGEYDVTLTVKDDSGFERHTVQDTARVSVGPKPNQRPEARIDAPRTARAGEIVTFSSEKSSDADGSLLTHDWSFANTGTASGPKLPHTFWEPGEYEVGLAVRDDSGRPNEKARDGYTIAVAPPANEAPVAKAGDARSGLTGVALEFDGSASADTDGNIVAYEWDFGDGATRRGARVKHAYDSPGTYTAKLTVTDHLGRFARSASQAVTVTIAEQPNTPPVADAGDDVTVQVGERIRFDAGASRDPDGGILKYEWDFADGFTSTGVAPHHIYQKAGIYEVALRVTDSGDNPSGTAEDRLTVTVVQPDNQPPVADAGEDFEVFTGEIVRLNGAASYDPDGNVTAFLWDFGTGERSERIAPLYAYQKPGVYRVRLTVWDDDRLAKLSASTELTVVVKDPPALDDKDKEASQ